MCRCPRKQAAHAGLQPFGGRLTVSPQSSSLPWHASCSYALSPEKQAAVAMSITSPCPLIPLLLVPAAARSLQRSGGCGLPRCYPPCLTVPHKPRLFLCRYALSPEKQAAVASETRRVWCSLAERLGMFALKVGYQMLLSCSWLLPCSCASIGCQTGHQAVSSELIAPLLEHLGCHPAASTTGLLAALYIPFCMLVFLAERAGGPVLCGAAAQQLAN